MGGKQHGGRLQAARQPIEQPGQVAESLRQAASRQEQQAPLTLQPDRHGGWLKAIHHRVAWGQGRHAMAPQAPGGEAVAHGHQPAAPLAHQGPFPRIPLTSLQVVLAIGQGRTPPPGGRRGGPGVVALGGADESVGAPSGPGQQQREQVTHRQDRIAAAAPGPHELPLPPAQQRQTGGFIPQQTPQALVAEAAAWEAAARADPAEQSPGLRRAIDLTFPHQGQDRHREPGMLALQGLHHLQGDHVFPVAVAQDQQGRGHAMADTIQPGEFAPGPAAWPSGKAED